MNENLEERPLVVRQSWMGPKPLLLARGTPQFLYVAQLVLPIAGVWRLHASVREAGQAVNITGPLSVGSPAGRLESLWLYLAFPPWGIALFAINQWQLK